MIYISIINFNISWWWPIY